MTARAAVPCLHVWRNVTGAVQQPLAIAVIGGFVAGLPLLLVVLPAMLRAIYRE